MNPRNQHVIYIKKQIMKELKRLLVQFSPLRAAGAFHTNQTRPVCKKITAHITTDLKTAGCWGPKRIRSLSAESWRDLDGRGAELRAFSSRRKEMRRGSKTATSWGPEGQNTQNMGTSFRWGRMFYLLNISAKAGWTCTFAQGSKNSWNHWPLNKIIEWNLNLSTCV